MCDEKHKINYFKIIIFYYSRGNKEKLHIYNGSGEFYNNLLMRNKCNY